MKGQLITVGLSELPGSPSTVSFQAGTWLCSITSFVREAAQSLFILLNARQRQLFDLTPTLGARRCVIRLGDDKIEEQ
jgi:hypothetical protein